MHIVNNSDANIIMAWCALITLALGLGAWWSRRQDRAIKRLEDKLATEQASGLRLRSYIWMLLHILDRKHIVYPPPPVDLYDVPPTQEMDTQK